MPKVSVIMNCLNAEKYLEAALSSVCAQTFQDYEIVFWDNGSTDNSAELAKAFGEKLRYFRGGETVSLGAARNLAIAQAKGEYLAFLDCDDVWRPTKLEKQLELFAKNPDLGLVATDTEIYDGIHVLNTLFAQTEPGRGKVFAELMQRQWIAMSSALVSRKALDASRDPQAIGAWFDENLHVCEEADVFYRIAHDYELDYVDEPLTVWRVHGKNATFNQFGQFAAETRAILAKHRRLYPGYEKEHGELCALLEKRASFQEAVAAWQQGRGAESRRLLRPYWQEGGKYRLFWFASFLPGSLFDCLARLYFALPARFRNGLGA